MGLFSPQGTQRSQREDQIKDEISECKITYQNLK